MESFFFFVLLLGSFEINRKFTSFFFIISDYRNHTWAMCPDGYFLQGFYRSRGTGLRSIEQATCCRPKDFKASLAKCYNYYPPHSILNGGWSRCPDWSYLAGVYKEACDELHCIETFRCCRMLPSGNPPLRC